ncbi:MAG: flagellar basal-body rod protein FlgG [Phycisphaerae bacterium]
MSMMALNTSATGLTALTGKLDVIANNLANVNTVGFKKSRVNFEDLLYQVRRQPGAENSLGNITPAGVEVGTGVKISGTQLMFDQGSLEPSNNQLDMAIDGNGFFKVQIFPDMGPNGVGYTRAGNFFINANNELVLGNRNGFRLEPAITIPENYTSIMIGSDGKVQVTTSSDAAAQDVGQIQLAKFVNSSGLLAKGQNVFVETAASGTPIEGNPTENGLGSILQNNLESSNVEPVKELVDLIQTQRSFELNSQSIKSSDEMLRVISNLKQ